MNELTPSLCVDVTNYNSTLFKLIMSGLSILDYHL